MIRTGPLLLRVQPCGCRYCEGPYPRRLWTSHRSQAWRVVAGRRAHLRQSVGDEYPPPSREPLAYRVWLLKTFAESRAHQRRWAALLASERAEGRS